MQSTVQFFKKNYLIKLTKPVINYWMKFALKQINTELNEKKRV